MSFWGWLTGKDRQAVLSKYPHDGKQIKMICGVSDIGLHTSDQIICMLPNTRLYEPRSIRNFAGRYHGNSLRIKGFSVRSGSMKGHSESHDELRLIDTGDLVITNQRLVFCGMERTVTMPLDQIVGTTHFTDAVRINRDGRDRSSIFGLDTKLSTVIDGVTVNAYGNIIACIIDQAKILAKCPRGMSAAEFMNTVEVTVDYERILRMRGKMQAIATSN
jgi:hypothetical protein